MGSALRKLSLSLLAAFVVMSLWGANYTSWLELRTRELLELAKLSESNDAHFAAQMYAAEGLPRNAFVSLLGPSDLFKELQGLLQAAHLQDSTSGLFGLQDIRVAAPGKSYDIEDFTGYELSGSTLFTSWRSSEGGYRIDAWDLLSNSFAGTLDLADTTLLRRMRFDTAGRVLIVTFGEKVVVWDLEANRSFAFSADKTEPNSRIYYTQFVEGADYFFNIMPDGVSVRQKSDGTIRHRIKIAGRPDSHLYLGDGRLMVDTFQPLGRHIVNLKTPEDISKPWPSRMITEDQLGQWQASPSGCWVAIRTWAGEVQLWEKSRLGSDGASPSLTLKSLNGRSERIRFHQFITAENNNFEYLLVKQGTKEVHAVDISSLMENNGLGCQKGRLVSLLDAESSKEGDVSPKIEVDLTEPLATNLNLRSDACKESGRCIVKLREGIDLRVHKVADDRFVLESTTLAGAGRFEAFVVDSGQGLLLEGVRGTEVEPYTDVSFNGGMYFGLVLETREQSGRASEAAVAASSESLLRVWKWRPPESRTLRKKLSLLSGRVGQTLDRLDQGTSVLTVYPGEDIPSKRYVIDLKQEDPVSSLLANTALSADLRYKIQISTEGDGPREVVLFKNEQEIGRCSDERSEIPDIDGDLSFAVTQVNEPRVVVMRGNRITYWDFGSDIGSCKTRSFSLKSFDEEARAEPGELVMLGEIGKTIDSVNDIIIVTTMQILRFPETGYLDFMPAFHLFQTTDLDGSLGEVNLKETVFQKSGALVAPIHIDHKNGRILFQEAKEKSGREWLTYPLKELTLAAVPKVRSLVFDEFHLSAFHTSVDGRLIYGGTNRKAVLVVLRRDLDIPQVLQCSIPTHTYRFAKMLGAVDNAAVLERDTVLEGDIVLEGVTGFSLMKPVASDAEIECPEDLVYLPASETVRRLLGARKSPSGDVEVLYLSDSNRVTLEVLERPKNVEETLQFLAQPQFSDFKSDLLSQHGLLLEKPYSQRRIGAFWRSVYVGSREIAQWIDTTVQGWIEAWQRHDAAEAGQ